MKHLYFMRHALCVMNEAGLFVGQTESPLSAAGSEQARAAGQDARSLNIDHILSSPYERAHATAQLIAKAIGYPVDKIELNDLLVERNFGSMEGQPWSPDTNMDIVAGAESVADLKRRVQAAYEYLQTIPANNILVVSHGATCRMFRHVIDPNVPFISGDKATKFPNAKIVQLR